MKNKKSNSKNPLARVPNVSKQENQWQFLSKFFVPKRGKNILAVEKYKNILFYF